MLFRSAGFAYIGFEKSTHIPQTYSEAEKVFLEAAGHTTNTWQELRSVCWWIVGISWFSLLPLAVFSVYDEGYRAFRVVHRALRERQGELIVRGEASREGTPTRTQNWWREVFLGPAGVWTGIREFLVTFAAIALTHGADERSAHITERR